MKLNTLSSAPLKKRRVLLRLELNVPLKKGKVADKTRIDAAIPTIKKILQKQATQVIIVSHLGRPSGKWQNRLSMKVVAKALQTRLKKKVTFINSHLSKIDKLPDEQIVFLENIRFYPEEQQNDKSLAKLLASHADVYVNDAFGTLHRKHASVNEITTFLPSYAGLLIEKEVSALEHLLKAKQPYLAIIGGGKADKIKVLRSFCTQADMVIPGGVCANMVLRNLNIEVGASIIEPLYDKETKKAIKTKKILPPIDVVVAKAPGKKTHIKTISTIEKEDMIVDLGPKTVKSIAEMIVKAKTVFWSGPIGMIEYPGSRKASLEIAKAMARSKAYTVVGGGDSAVAVNLAKVGRKIDHLSTGGGASLLFVEKGTLVSLKKLEKKERKKSALN